MNKHDDVTNPAHYDLFPGQQSIDVIQAALTPEEFAGFCKGNALKYRLRAGEKGDALQDLAKANWYRDRLRVSEHCKVQAALALVQETHEFDEERADIIGQNGNDGEHYERPWIEWHGGIGAPVADGTIIDVRDDDGEEYIGIVCGRWETLPIYWQWKCSKSVRIIAYRLHA